jgi:hypothetical protein
LCVSARPSGVDTQLFASTFIATDLVVEGFVRRRVLGLVAAVLAAVTVALPAAARAGTPDGGPPSGTASAAPSSIGGNYVRVAPFRAVDTRKAQRRSPARRLQHRTARTVQIGGLGSVPKTGVVAVAVTITAYRPTSSGALVAYPSRTPEPAIRTLSYTTGHDTSVSVLVRTSRAGAIALYNVASAGAVDVTVDVAGYLRSGAEGQAGALQMLAPHRVFDNFEVAGRRAATVTVGGRQGVPRSGVGAAAVLITVYDPARAGTLTAYSNGNDRPSSPVMSFLAGRTTTQFAIVPTDDAGRFAVANGASAPVHLAVDLVGWVPAGPAAGAGTVQTRFPARVLPATRLLPHASRAVAVAGRAGVPRTGVAAVLVNLTASAPTARGDLVAWQSGRPAPRTTTVQFEARANSSGTAIVAVSAAGSIAVRNDSAGRSTLTVDVLGYVPSSTIHAPPRSNSRYIHTAQELDGAFARQDTTGEGCVDATSSSSVVLVDLGAQVHDRLAVQLTGSHNDVVPYSRLVSDLQGYVDSFAQCMDGTATIAIGTNNDGNFEAGYSAAERGTQWADDVVDEVSAPVGVTIAGANDIEPGFAGGLTDAQDWEGAFLAATDAGLIFNGSADGCPTGFGHPGESCAYDWTERDLYGLAHADDGRIHALPQIYNAGMAAQWANIDATGGGKIVFAGALTQAQVCASGGDCALPTYAAAEGWAALYRAIATVVERPNIPAVTDLRADT